MEQSQLLSLAKIVLPSYVLDYFNIVSVASTREKIFKTAAGLKMLDDMFIK